ncbi:putative acetyltransferase At3g50280 [Wolffia australiana]
MFSSQSSMHSSSSVVQVLSENIVMPATVAATHPRRCELSLWDVSMFSIHYIQKGHLFSLPTISQELDAVVNRLKSSLSVALSLFYPLAGRLAVELDGNGDGLYAHIDCNDQGAGFILAAAPDVAVADVLSEAQDVPGFVCDLFPCGGAVSYDGRLLPLVSVQVTTLDDGFFLGCAFNHAVGDGTSFWAFFNAWAKISRSSNNLPISLHPVLDRWSTEGVVPPIKLPFTEEAQFIERFSPPPLREKFFHFPGAIMAQLKSKANEETGLGKISSFQALSALMWRCITRVRHFHDDQEVGCRLAAENRQRLRPPLPAEYFGNSIYAIATVATAGELLGNNLGWAAGLLNKTVAAHNDVTIRDSVARWAKQPRIYRVSDFDRFTVMMGSSPRFDMYGCDFGWGKAKALRSGAANKFDGKVSAYPARNGAGGVDLEVCLLDKAMVELEADEEFVQFVGEAW